VLAGFRQTQLAEWRTDRVNEVMLEREGYLSEEAKKSINGGG